MISYPFSCELNITNKCNLNCYFCSMESTCEVCDFGNFSSENIDVIIRKLKEVYCCYVSLSGGEPMLHPDFYNIATKLIMAGFKVTMATNGTLINETSLKRIEETGISWVQISMHSFTGETCRKIMGFDVQDRIMKAIQLIADKSNMGLSVCIVRNKYNKYEIPQIVEYLESNCIGYLFRDEIGVGRIKNTILPEPDINKLMKQYVDNRDSDKGKVRKFSILSNGDIVTCSELGIPMGNIFIDNLKEIWINNKIIGLCKGCGNTPCLANYYHNNPLIKKKVDEINA